MRESKPFSKLVKKPLPQKQPQLQKLHEVEEQTIADYSVQWQAFRTNDSYYGSLELLQDIFGPLLTVQELRGVHVADIGSGTGRIVQMLLQAGAKKIVAVEPSQAFEVMKENLKNVPGKVEILQIPGERLPPQLGLDFVVSMGVLDHTPRPQAIVQAAYQALRPGGRIVIWVYGREGNALYLAFALPLRRVTPLLPHPILLAFTGGLNILLSAYIWACRALPLPLHRYMRDGLSRLSPVQRKLVIYDQLNPTYAKYYRRAEVESLLRSAGFKDIQLYHRHGYSWTAMGRRPIAPSER